MREGAAGSARGVGQAKFMPGKRLSVSHPLPGKVTVNTRADSHFIQLHQGVFYLGEVDTDFHQVYLGQLDQLSLGNGFDIGLAALFVFEGVNFTKKSIFGQVGGGLGVHGLPTFFHRLISGCPQRPGDNKVKVFFTVAGFFHHPPGRQVHLNQGVQYADHRRIRQSSEKCFRGALLTPGFFERGKKKLDFRCCSGGVDVPLQAFGHNGLQGHAGVDEKPGGFPVGFGRGI